jgi:hypothetical protein
MATVLMISTARLFQAYVDAGILISRFVAGIRPMFRGLWLLCGTAGNRTIR